VNRVDGDEVSLWTPDFVCCPRALLTLHRKFVRSLFGDCGELVVEILGSPTHEQRILRKDAELEQRRVGLLVKFHWVAAHVFDPTSDCDLNLTEADARSESCYRGHGTRAHAIDGEPRHGSRQSSEKANGPTKSQALVTLVGGRSDCDIVDCLGG
jgi:hypothetical protein